MAKKPNRIIDKLQLCMLSERGCTLAAASTRREAKRIINAYGRNVKIKGEAKREA